MNINVGDTIRVVAKMRDGSNSLIENRYFWRHTGAATADSDQVLDDLENALSTSYEYVDGYMPDTLEPVEIVVDLVQFSGGKIVTIQPVGTIAWTTWTGGESAAEIMPEGIAAVVNFPTGVPRTQGRKFIGPLTEAANTNGRVTGGLLLDLINYAATFLLGWTFDSQDFTTGLMSKHTLGLIPFTAFVIPSPLGYQRRRKPGVGA